VRIRHALRATDGRLSRHFPFPVWLARSKSKPMFYAYVLESLSVPDELYRGHTANLKQRLADHNAGTCLHTSKFKPWKVKLYVASRDAAETGI